MVRRLVALAVAAVALAGGVSAVSTTAAYADARTAIANAAISQIGKAETGTNYYPIAYKIDSTIVRPAAWCGIFANWAWWKGGASARPNMTGSGTAQGHWATYWQKWAKDHNRWKPIANKNPAPGDVVVYGNYPDSRHVGVVVQVRKGSDGKVTQIRSVEGNFGDKVTDRGWRNIGSLTGGGASATGFASPVAL